MDYAGQSLIFMVFASRAVVTGLHETVPCYVEINRSSGQTVFTLLTGNVAMFIKKTLLMLSCCCTLVGAQSYTLTINSDTGGTTSPSGAVIVQSGIAQQITAFPDSGYQFYSWSILNLSGTVRFSDQLASTSVIIEGGDATIQANFKLKGAVYNIESSDHEYNYTTDNYNPASVASIPGVAFCFTAPTAGAYAIVVEDVDSSVKYLMNYGKDSLFTTYSSYTYGPGKLTSVFMASAADTKHYFSVLISNSAHRGNNFSIRYQPAATLTVEHSGLGSTYPSGNVAIRTDTSLGLTATTSSPLFYFDHWEVVNGMVTIDNPALAVTNVAVSSGDAIVHAVFLMHPADTIIVENDGNGRTYPGDTVFIAAGGDTTITAIPNGGHMFDSWTVEAGNATFGSAANARTSVAVSSGKATVRAHFLVDTNTSPTVVISGIDISGHPDICVTASVTDTAGRSITGLDSSFFSLSEDGDSPSFHLTTVTEAGGTSVCLVIDKSGSMSGTKISDAIAAAQTYIATMNQYDRCAIVAFDSKVQVIHEMSSDKAALHEAVGQIGASGGTTVLNGADLGIDQLLQETNPRSVIIFSDGQGNGTISIDSVINHALHNNVSIYSIGIGTAQTSPLKDIADATGGFYTYAPDAGQLSEIYATIKRTVEARYIFCYETDDLVFNGDTHAVVVSVNMNGTTSRDTTWWDESNKPPVIILTTETAAMITEGRPEHVSLNITADITDDGSVRNVKLFYRTTGSNASYTEAVMTTKNSGNTYQVTLPADSVVSPGVDFYILAADNKNLIGKSPNILSPESKPWCIRIGGSGLKITVSSDTVIDEGTVLQLVAEADDFSDTVPSLSATGLPDGAVFVDSGNGIGVFTWSTGCNDHGEYSVTFRAANGFDTVEATCSITVRDVNFAPQIVPLNDTTISISLACTLTVRTIDCDDEKPHLEAASVPEGSIFNDNGDGTGTLAWTARSVDDGKYTTIFTASDDSFRIEDTVVIVIFDTTRSIDTVDTVVIIDTIIPQVPAQLTGGRYVDENGDGMVDAVYMRFTKKVPLDSMAISLYWTGAGTPRIGPLSGTALSDGGDSVTVRVAVPDTIQRTNGIKTDGGMSASVLLTAFPEVSCTTMVADSAAPVIDSALGREGVMAPGTASRQDTLCVWFSERVRLAECPTPFTLFNDTSSMHSPRLRLHSHQDNYAVYLVDDPDSLSAPRAGDSLFINPHSAVGDSMVWQNNPDNRRVALTWKPGSEIFLIPVRSNGNDPMDISRIAGAFGIRATNGKIIAVTSKQPFDTLQRNERPVFDRDDGTPVYGTAQIFDAVGNLVKYDAFVKKSAIDRTYYVLWNGTNQNRRRVAPGAYLINVSVAIDKMPFKKNEKFIIKW